ncbi:unnamed protein product [Paramecium primaurelia]|uniref:Uncharacterized protein n=1 Tax=Paramecium primaurelia TaxID=5886 RepID=A0A8S1QCT8_PARPR|nr:unnamed protein product [Paramecium primaurelia]CAD8112894.1 unnamed protein product [Paramecium primaurelia]
MSYYYNKQQDQALLLPNGYQQQQNSDIQTKQTNYQYFLQQAITQQQKEDNFQIKIIPKNHIIHHRNRIFQDIPEIKVRQELYQTRYKSTPGKRNQIFNQDYSIDQTHQNIIQQQQISTVSNNNIKSLILSEIDTIKQKSQLYSITYSELLQKLIQIFESKKEYQNLQMDPEFNNILFKIRTFQGLDITRKIQIEKIIKDIVNQDEKLLFQGLVKDIIQNDWMYWIEPLYFDIQKQQIPKEQWKSFIEKQKQIYKI